MGDSILLVRFVNLKYCLFIFVVLEERNFWRDLSCLWYS